MNHFGTMAQQLDMSSDPKFKLSACLRTFREALTDTLFAQLSRALLQAVSA
jgi:hypothetical protein